MMMVHIHTTFHCTKGKHISNFQVPLGVIDKDESKVADMIDILEEYNQYVPSVNNKPRPVLLFGDGLSCERVLDAKNARMNARDPWDRFEGIEPAAQEWHKRLLLLGVSI